MLKLATAFDDRIDYIEDNDMSDFNNLSPLPDRFPICTYLSNIPSLCTTKILPKLSSTTNVTS